MKVYHAHGYAVRDVERIAGTQEWKENSRFSAVFSDFAQAKAFLMKKFSELLHEICARDIVLRQNGKPFAELSEKCQEEYIADHIDYALIVSEVDEGAADGQPLRIDRYLRYDGADRKRYFVYPEKKIEYRVGNELPAAGTKFKAGDLVTYCGTPTGYYHETVLLVYETPHIPTDRTKPWENRYRLLHFDLPEYYYDVGHFRDDTLHENDMRPCTEEFLEALKEDGAQDLLLPLQAMIRAGKMTKQLLRETLNKKFYSPKSGGGR